MSNKLIVLKTKEKGSDGNCMDILKSFLDKDNVEGLAVAAVLRDGSVATQYAYTSNVGVITMLGAVSALENRVRAQLQE